MAVYRNFSIINTTGVEVIELNDKILLRLIKDVACAFTIRFTDKTVGNDLVVIPQAKQLGLLSTAPTDPLVPVEWALLPDVIPGLDITSASNPIPSSPTTAEYYDLVFEGTPTDLTSGVKLYVTGLGYGDIWYYTSESPNRVTPLKYFSIQIVNPKARLNIGKTDGTIKALPNGFFNHEYLPEISPAGFTFTVLDGNGTPTWNVPVGMPPIPSIKLTVAPDKLSATLAGKFISQEEFIKLKLINNTSTQGNIGECLFNIELNDEVYTTPEVYRFKVPFVGYRSRLTVFPSDSNAFSSSSNLIPVDIEYDSRIFSKTIFASAPNNIAWKVNNTPVVTSVSIGSGLSVYLTGTSLYVKGTPASSLVGKSLTFSVQAIEDVTNETTDIINYTLYFKPFDFTIDPSTLIEISTGLPFELNQIRQSATIRTGVNNVSWVLTDYGDWPPGLKLIKNVDTNTYLDPTHLSSITFTADTDYLAVYGTATGARATPYSFTLQATYTEGFFIKQVRQKFYVKMTALGTLTAIPSTNTTLAIINTYQNTKLFSDVLRANGATGYAWTLDTFYPDTISGITLVNANTNKPALSIAQQKTTGADGYVYFNATVTGTDCTPASITNRYIVKINNIGLGFNLSPTNTYIFRATKNYEDNGYDVIKHSFYTLESGQSLNYSLVSQIGWPPGLKLIKNLDNTTYLDDTHNTPIVCTDDTDKLTFYGIVPDINEKFNITVQCSIKENGIILNTQVQTYTVSIVA